tara:strand:- start:1016 stop:1885 length:870 start_codon:yes stop_codon:yes gene_type:complete
MDININSMTGIPNNYLNILDANPKVIFVVGAIIIIYFVIFASLGEKNVADDNSSNNYVVFLELLMWSIFILLILLNGVSYLFNVDITTGIKNLFSSDAEVNIKVDSGNLSDILKNGESTNESTSESTSESNNMLKEEVYHIPGNKYTFNDAKAIAKSFGGRLATYKEVEEAYNKGADWCSYGWSKGQMALFPTQESKWNNLQEIEGHEHDCGRPGINGGFIDNPNVKFGVNCYGIKPNITPEEIKRMENSVIYQKTNKEIRFDELVDEWKQKLPNILLSPFNTDNWNMV